MTEAQHMAKQPLVLIVEDDADTRAYLQTILDEAGYHTVVAASGAEALEAVDQVSVDMLLLDVMLPDTTGYEVCAVVKQDGARDVPVLMMSALGQTHNVVQGLEQGADDYLRKPFVGDELLARMDVLLRRREQIQAAQRAGAAETLLRQEMLHNVATHMQALCGIVDAELRKLPPSPERETVQRIRGRVYGAALVYQTSEALTSDPVHMGALIPTIATSLKAMYRPWRRVLVDVQGGDAPVPNVVAAPLAMVVNELVTNCFKHAFPNNSFGKIAVRYGVEGDVFWVEVADDGVGFDQHAPSGGGGRRAVAQLIGSLNGTVQWEPATPGTRVTVRVPLTSSTAS